MELPPKIYAYVRANSDGTYSMYLDPRRSREQQIEDYIHELMHIINNDMTNGLPILIIEAAEGGNDMNFGPQLVSVKVLGVRTVEQTKVLATYNSTIYCLMLIYSDGRRELEEVEAKKMSKYLQYIDI